ncbi:MAG: FMN-binding negative transcriptional regulator [Thermomicrobiales bacterium]
MAEPSSGNSIPETAMRRNPLYVTMDQHVVRELIKAHPWATFVSQTQVGMVASHYPILLDENDTEGITILTHFGRPDDTYHELGGGEMLVIVQGPHGYISPSWYENDEFIPTWNFVTAHLHGHPEILTPDENLAVLERLVDHFEEYVENPRSLRLDMEQARAVAQGTVGIRIPIIRFEARQKLSQNKSPEVIERIITQLQAEGPYRQQDLADVMVRVNESRISSAT